MEKELLRALLSRLQWIYIYETKDDLCDAICFGRFNIFLTVLYNNFQRREQRQQSPSYLLSIAKQNAHTTIP